MPPLHTLIAALTAADRNLEPPYPGAAHDFFLILEFQPLQPQPSTASRALLGGGHLDLFVHMIGDGPLVVAAVRCAGLAAGRLGIALWLAAREGRGLTLSGVLRGFQFLAQPFQLVFQPLVLLLQLLGFLPSSVTLLPRATQFLCQFANPPDRIEILKEQIIV